jgi:hypothetical protein
VAKPVDALWVTHFSRSCPGSAGRCRSLWRSDRDVAGVDSGRSRLSTAGGTGLRTAPARRFHARQVPAAIDRAFWVMVSWSAACGRMGRRACDCESGDRVWFWHTIADSLDLG